MKRFLFSKSAPFFVNSKVIVSAIIVMMSSPLMPSVALSQPRDCSLQAEGYVGIGYSKPGVLLETLEDGNMIYQVLTIDQGGDAAYLVTVKPNCKLVDVRLIWSE